MSRKRVSMRQIRQIMFYRLEKGICADQTTLALKISKGTVINTTKPFEESGLPWPLPEDITDSTLEARLYPVKASSNQVDPNLPGLSYIEEELSKKHVTLQRLYDEYLQTTSDPVSRSGFTVKPKDKSKVESAVLHIQRYILAGLRNRQFFSLSEINEAIQELLEEFNDCPMKDYGYQTRRERFENMDRPCAQRLPAEPFRVIDVKPDVLVAKNYQVRYKDHYYSVPFQLATKRVIIKHSGMMIEIVYDGQIVTCHIYNPHAFKYSTKKEHMPEEHQFVKGLTPGWIIAQAAKIGPETVNAVTEVMRRSEHVPFLLRMNTLKESRGV